MNFLKKALSVVAVAISALMLSAPAHAAGGLTIDTTDVVTTITNGVTTVSAIGIAVLSLVVCIKLFKWVQRVL
jgi:hypothetical protein